MINVYLFLLLLMESLKDSIILFSSISKILIQEHVQYKIILDQKLNLNN